MTPPTKPSRPTSTISIASSVQSTGAVTNTDMRPPSIDRKLKPATPGKVFTLHMLYFTTTTITQILKSIAQYETGSLHRRGGPSNLSFAASTSYMEFHTDLNADKFSKTLPRNYNNSSSSTAAAASVLSVTQAPITIASLASGRQIGKLDYFDLDPSNAPPICKNTNPSISTSDLSSIPTHQKVAAIRHSGFVSAPSTSDNSTATGTLKRATLNDPVSAAPSTAAASGIVYKKVDFIKTDAFMRTRQDAELNRAKNRLKE